MAATTSGAIKAHIESLGLGVPVFRDGPRPGQALPYIVVSEGLDITPAAAQGDYGDPARERVVAEMVQVDVVQAARTPAAGRAPNAEQYGLAERVYAALDGARLPQHPAPVSGVVVREMRRLPIRDNVLRHAITAHVYRQLQAA